MGFCANTGTGKDQIVYQIMSPASDIDWHKNLTYYKELGYSGAGLDAYYHDLVAHEFCYSFTKPIIQEENYQETINQTDSLFVPELDSVIKKES
jgi:hypothetical protein